MLPSAEAAGRVHTRFTAHSLAESEMLNLTRPYGDLAII